jgi:hypothetical protein
MKARLSWLNCLLLPASVLAQSPDPQIPATQDKPVAPSAERLRSFNSEDFALAYEVMVGNAQLERALQLARQAVLQLPKDRAWRRKLARVAEWLSQDELAAEQWEALFALGDRAQDTLAGLRRLAHALNNPALALQAWAYLAARTPLTEQQWGEIVRLYENTGQALQGSRYFETQYRRKKLPLLLEHAARLASNAGEDERAQKLYLERIRLAPFSIDAVLQAVLAYIHKDRIKEALALMQSQSARVPQDVAEYWRLLGQLAWDLNDYASAEQAYQRSAKSRQGLQSDWSRLTFLVRQKQPRAAAELAMQAYQRFDALDQLLQALTIYAELGDTLAQKRIYQSLTPAQRTRAEANAYFLLGRSQFWQAQGDQELAWADLRRAAVLSPQDDAIALATLWFLIDTQRSVELKIALQQYRSQASDNPAYWLAYASGHQLTAQYQQSATWYRKLLQRTPDDPLLLLNYADALELMHHTGMADRVRRQAWLKLKAMQPDAKTMRQISRSPELQAWVQLSLRNQPGDPGMKLVQLLAQQLREPGTVPGNQEAIDNLILGWAIAQQQYANARSWILQRYVQQNKQVPLWIDTLLAQQFEDRPRMAELLKTQGDKLPASSRFDMALALGEVEQALATAHQGMAQAASAEDLYERFRQLAPLRSNYFQARAFNENLDSLERKGVKLEARWVVNTSVHLLAGWSRVAQSSNDPDFATLLPAQDRLDHLELRWLQRHGESRITVMQRTELQSQSGLRLRQTGRLAPRLDYEAGLDYRNESLLSLPLRAAGNESSLYAGVNYNVSKRDNLHIVQRFNRYYTQYEDALGSGRILEVEAGHRLRLEYPDLRLRVFAVDQDFKRDGSISSANLARLPAFLQSGIASGAIEAASYMIPESSTTYGACVSMGDNLAGVSLQTHYSRAWRPFLDACLRHNTVTGEGYTGVLGLAGSISGSDHMALKWEASNGAVPGSSATRILSVSYRHYF